MRTHDDPGGFTLVELAVAMGISAVLMAAVFSFFLFTTRSYRSGGATLRLQREAARAVEEMAQAVRAGTSLGPSGDVTDSLSIATPATTYDFAADGGILTEAIGGGAAQRFFDDADIAVAGPSGLQFTKLTDDSSGTAVTTGVTIRLTLSHRLVAEPVSSEATVSLRNTVAPVPPTPLPTTPPAPTLPQPTIPLPTATMPLPTPTAAMPTPTLPPPTAQPTSGAPPGPTATSAPTPTPTPICILGVCL